MCEEGRKGVLWIRTPSGALGGPDPLLHFPHLKATRLNPFSGYLQESLVGENAQGTMGIPVIQNHPREHLEMFGAFLLH